MIEKTVAIGDKQVTFRSSASVPRLYRIKFKRVCFAYKAGKETPRIPPWPGLFRF